MDLQQDSGATKGTLEEPDACSLILPPSSIFFHLLVWSFHHLLLLDLLQSLKSLVWIARPTTHLDDAGSIFEVCEGPHYVPTHCLHRLFPGGREASNQLGDTSWGGGRRGFQLGSHVLLVTWFPPAEPSPSSPLRRSSWPFSIRASASFTKAIIPPKGGDRISSMNSWTGETNERHTAEWE